ncbi:unnamed protein product, partial [Iphiclides podalirius]
MSISEHQRQFFREISFASHFCANQYIEAIPLGMCLRGGGGVSGRGVTVLVLRGWTEGGLREPNLFDGRGAWNAGSIFVLF